MYRAAFFGLLFTLLSALPAEAQSPREAKVRGDRKQIEEDGNWIYNDLEAGIAQAKQSGKPLLVVFRCVPCEACAQLDSEVAERDPRVRKLLDQFVCVRIVHANGMDLTLFQFDYDQSLAAFFLNADRTIYGRYGTRSHETESDDDVTLAGFAKALEGALQLHKHYPANQPALRGKQGPPASARVPEEFPSLRGRYDAKLNYEGNVVQSCIHCHQVSEAERQVFRTQSKPIPEKVLYPYPHPKVLGLVMDPDETATVKEVMPQSTAAQDGFRTGDRIVSLEGQPLLSIADLQWVLHNAGSTGKLKAEVERDGRRGVIGLTLDEGWRRKGDLSWRATSWDLRRMATGGLVLEEVSAEQRRGAGIGEDRLALRVKHVGQWGPHAAAKQAGFAKGDVLVEVGGKSHRMSESELLAFLLKESKPGERVPVSVLRGTRKLTLQLPTQ